MTNSDSARYHTMLGQLLNKQITPRSVVGSGYKHPRQVASSWIRTQIHNIENPSQKISEMTVATNGTAFSSESLAMKSATYQACLSNSLKTINDSIVSDYGVMPAPGGDGYCVYVCLEHRKVH